MGPIKALKMRGPPLTMMQSAGTLPSSSGRAGFAEAMKGARRGQSGEFFLGQELHTSLSELRRAILQRKELSSRELLLYQMRAADLALRVELTAKAADGLVATMRRLQNPQ